MAFREMFYVVVGASYQQIQESQDYRYSLLFFRGVDEMQPQPELLPFVVAPAELDAPRG